MEKGEKEILERLAAQYYDTKSGLNFNNPFELLIATILSAQATDVHVNKVTKGLFAAYPDAKTLGELSQQKLENEIRSIGLYRNKAKNILSTCKALNDRYDGQVPNEREALEMLPGVGRKTASVVLCNAFEKPAFAVDTHVFRVSYRLGLASGKNVLTTEKELCKLIPEEQWCDAHHWLIWHGRGPCKARTPQCLACFLVDICPQNGV